MPNHICAWYFKMNKEINIELCIIFPISFLEIKTDNKNNYTLTFKCTYICVCVCACCNKIITYIFPTSPIYICNILLLYSPTQKI